jgi:glyoxylase-like metal-dependent hydrolase (beta-lactamase superfamily II)
LALRLEAAGIDPASVTDVVLTHIHMNHIGGLLADGLKGRLRPDLRVHAAAAEAEFWESPDFSHTSMPPGVPDSLRSAASRFLDEYRSQLCHSRPSARWRSRATPFVAYRPSGITDRLLG